MPADTQTAEWRAQLKKCQERLQNEFFTQKNTSKLLKSHAKSVDAILKDIWQTSDLNHCALIAVGGYGRGELFPHSDVDLLILLPEECSLASNQKIERLVGLLWDIGLAVGHSVRTLDECIEEATKDVTVQTNLIESRQLAGNLALFKSFQTKVDHAINVPTFIKAKIEEQEQRHKRFNDTTYNLEPNIKESPGGLRDLQTILWLSRATGLGGNWNTLVKRELITASELRQIRRHEQHLQTLRIHLHYMAKRREDRLIFDLQNSLAEALGYSK
jgi:[protein-PII] uridylyltransferase